MALRAGGIVAICLISACALAQRVAPNSFIDHRVSTVSQLVSETKNNPDVMDRFKRHFAMSDEQVISYLGSLHLSRLRESAVYTVYSVPSTGYVKAHSERLAAGTAVFSDMNGTPILLVKCGNPISKGPNNPVELATVRPRPALAPMHEEAPVGEVAPAPPVYAAAPPEAPVLAPLPITPAPPVTRTAQVAPGGIGPWPLLLLPLAFIHNGGGEEHHKQPVPEPTTIIALGAGAAALIARKRRSKA